MNQVINSSYARPLTVVKYKTYFISSIKKFHCCILSKRFNFISKYFWVKFETHTKDFWYRRTSLLRLAFAYLFYSIGWFGLWRLMPLSTIFQLYSGSQFLVEEIRLPGKNPPTCRKSLTNLIT